MTASKVEAFKIWLQYYKLHGFKPIPKDQRKKKYNSFKDMKKHKF